MTELFRRLRSNPMLFMEISIASLFANVLALATPLFVIQVLNRYVAQGVDATLVTLTTGALLAIVFEFIFRQIRVRLARAVSDRMNTEISLAGFGVLLKAKAGVLERISIGQRNQIMALVPKIENAFGAGNTAIVFDTPFSLLFLGVLYLLSPVLAGICASFIVIVYCLGWIGARHQQSITRQILSEAGTENMLLNTASSNLDTVRGFNAVAFMYQAWVTLLNKTTPLRQSSEASQGLNATLAQSATALMSVALIATAAVLVVAGRLDVGTMIGANILAARALAPIVRLSQLGVVFAEATENLKQLKEFAAIPQEAASGSSKPKYSGSIELKDMAFAYPGSSTPLFESLSLTFEPGSITAVCGSNGVGKTTFARVLTGILEPTRGQVLVDGLDLKQASLEWWRMQLAYLPQEPTLLNTTIRGNLLLLDPEADEGKLSDAINAAGLSAYLDESPDGLNTVVAGNGANLSLGIRRRISLARALISTCKVAIFDEPTDGLDRDGIACIYSVMNDLAAKGCTIIVISHDTKILKGAHRVIDLNEKPVPRVTDRPRTVASSATSKRDAS